MKVAISLPDPVFEAAETLAGRLGKSRSQLYAEAIKTYVGSHPASDVTRRLNQVYASMDSKLDPALLKAQTRILKHETW